MDRGGLGRENQFLPSDPDQPHGRASDILTIYHCSNA